MPTLVLEILDGIAIDGFLPDAPHGLPYSATLRGYGATEPLQWAVVDGALPAGWTLDPATGEVAGDADIGGRYDVTIMLSDVLGYYTTRRFDFGVGYAPILISGGPFEWAVGAPVSDHLTITGGSGVYTEFRAQVGELPPGVTATIVGSQVVFGGTPTAAGIGEDSLAYHVYDDAGGFGFGRVDWEVTSPPKILLGGAFTTINGASQAYIARLNADGTLDTSFAPAINGSVSQIVVQSDGKILVMGGFTTVNGAGRYHIARLNADGTLDTSFDAGYALNYYARQFALQSNGKIVVANASGGNAIIRLNTDGSLDSTFPAVYANNMVIAIHVLPDDRILASGYYTTIGGVSTAGKLTLLSKDGVVDASFAPAVSGPDGGYVQRFSRQSDGKTLIAGRIKSIFGTSVSMVFRLNADLTLDTSWRPYFDHPDNSAYSAVQMSSGDVLCCGLFSMVHNSTAWVYRDYIAVINGSTQYPTAFAPTVNARSYDALEMPNGNILHVGIFTAVNGVARSRVSMLTPAGASVSSFTASANSTVNVVELQYL